MMVDHLDQESKLERRTLRAANELFLKLLHAEAQYDPTDDFARSIDEAYRVIRERKANGGPGWGGWE
jgi:hypothetical protein